ncbi:hypothetical protein DK842_05045 [Chromobacterium phragmitis]|uniref:DUF1842 domain-containing protein n=1 Tax=Chromobacterium phragmitis TaxID=2202141 RepID=A0A344UHF1_9NEIS|nr:DUF1842 domain-containing protein [Chromobacterium phragmitis]AXE29328.1 hypothetical protein DK842_05045 [Chromobacterium phragmitis]AXE34699.1 hypothetical protein DK843_10565 [Chromobacterium phragmitis]
MANQADRDQKSGLFIVNYNVFKSNQVGGYNLQLRLSVYPPARRVTGEAIITHATAQPLVFENQVQGHYEENGGNVELILQGVRQHHAQDQQGQQQQAHAHLREDFFFDGLLKGGWRAEHGSHGRYAFRLNGRWIEEIGQEIQQSEEQHNAHKALRLL